MTDVAGLLLLRVQARDRVSTVMNVTAGQTYTFSASGWWVDAYIPCGAGGYGLPWLRPFEKDRIVPGAKWFCLIALFDKSPDQPLEIGKNRRWDATASGQLTFMANDIPSKYWNNFGHLRLAVTWEPTQTGSLT